MSMEETVEIINKTYKNFLDKNFPIVDPWEDIPETYDKLKLCRIEDPTIEDFGNDLLEVYDIEDYGIYLSREEANYDLHNMNGLCGCFECEEYRKKLI